MVYTPIKTVRFSLNIRMVLALFLIAGFVLSAGCSIPRYRNTTAGNSSPSTITPLTTDTPQTTVPVPEVTSTVIRKGLLSVYASNYTLETPISVSVDNATVGNVSPGKSLNLTVDSGLHVVRACVIGTCIEEEVLVISTNPSAIDFGERLRNEVFTGPLIVSIQGYDAELPVFIDNTSAGNVTMIKPLDLRISEGFHTVKVCVGILCVNETVKIRFAQPAYVDFGQRLKKVAEFSTPTIRIADYLQTGTRVRVDVEFINPSKKDLTMSATVQLAYSYINPRTHWRAGTLTDGTLSRTVRAGNRTKQSLNLTLSGGSGYLIEIPVLRETSIT